MDDALATDDVSFLLLRRDEELYGLAFLAEDKVNPLDFETSVCGRWPMTSHPRGVGRADDVPAATPFGSLRKLRTLSRLAGRRDVVVTSSSEEG